MGLSITFYPICPRAWEQDHVMTSVRLVTERCAELYHQFDAYGFPPECPSQENVPYAIIKLQPVSEKKQFYLWEDEKGFKHDRIGGFKDEKGSNFVFLMASDFHKIEMEVIKEYPLCWATVHYIRALPDSWPILVWRG